MKSFWKWLFRTCGGLLAVTVILAVALAGTGVWLVRRPWPKVRGTIEVAGLLAPAEVIRDRWGIPHVYAQNEHDLFFAQGYVHAQDRLWQMEMTRRFGSGTVSEVIGVTALEYDIYQRTIGVRRLAEQSWSGLDEETRTVLEAYAEGVNAYVETYRDRLPWEFAILEIEPEPWTPIDSLAISNYQAAFEGLDAVYELFRTEFIARLGKETAVQIQPLFHGIPSVISIEETTGQGPLPEARPAALAHEDDRPGEQSPGSGSNNWVVHGSRTVTGMPILANDPHLVLHVPSLFYENGVHGGRFESVGLAIPGVPLVVIGHNRHVAWGITNLAADVQDLYVEKLDREWSPTQYEYLGEWHDVEVIEEIIDVAGGQQVEAKVYLTRHGPLVREIPHSSAFLMTGAPHPGEQVSFRWSVDGDSAARTLKSIVLLNLATNWPEFREALASWETLAENFVYADVEGNIGYQAAGRIPIRTPGHQGILPVPGWTGEYEWQGFVPFDELPSTLNPPEGFVVTANNRMAPDDYDYVLGYMYDPGQRAARITELLSANDLLTVEDMQAIQGDTYSPAAKALRPYLLALDPENDLESKALTYVEAWDLRYEANSVGASVFEAWCYFLMLSTVGDEYGDRFFDDFITEDYVLQVLMMIDLMADADSEWFDNVRTSRVETRDEIAQRSLTRAVDWLRKNHGEDPARWEWGRIQTKTFVHFPLGQGIEIRRFFPTGLVARILDLNNGAVARSANSALARALNIEQVPVEGNLFAVNSSAYRTDLPFEAYFAPLARMVVDVSDWDNSWAVLTPGQSEHILHPNRQDQLSLWQNVEYRPMPFSQEAVERNAETRLTMTP
jgi:penicillin amidase